MDNVILKYKNGDSFARETLIGNIMEMYNYSLTREEAIILLYKKYGAVEVF